MNDAEFQVGKIDDIVDRRKVRQSKLGRFPFMQLEVGEGFVIRKREDYRSAAAVKTVLNQYVGRTFRAQALPGEKWAIWREK